MLNTCGLGWGGCVIVRARLLEKLRTRAHDGHCVCLPHLLFFYFRLTTLNLELSYSSRLLPITCGMATCNASPKSLPVSIALLGTLEG